MINAVNMDNHFFLLDHAKTVYKMGDFQMLVIIIMIKNSRKKKKYMLRLN